MSTDGFSFGPDLDALIGPVDAVDFDAPLVGLPSFEIPASADAGDGEGYTVEFDEPDPFAPVPGTDADDYLGINPQDLVDNWDAPLDLDLGF